MAEVLQISQLGNPVLRQIAQPVSNLHSSEMQRLIDRLMATLVQSNGVGIAAPQVAASVQLLIVASRPNPRYPNAPQMEPTVMVNPRLLSHDEAQVKDWEGCLSIPGIRGFVPRYKEIEVEYFDRNGNPHRQILTDFVARIFQHEADHLAGKVFLDRLAHHTSAVAQSDRLELAQSDRLEPTQDIITDQEYLTRVLNQP